MASINRTAYPRFSSNRILKAYELEHFYTPTEEELNYMNENIRGDDLKLAFMVQLKVFQHLKYFPALKKIPKAIVQHIKECCGFVKLDIVKIEYAHNSALYRHRNCIRELLKITAWQKSKRNPGKPLNPAQHYAVKVAYEAAQTMNNVADIINVVIEELVKQNYELPAFSTLNRLVKHTRALVNRKIFAEVYAKLSGELIAVLNDLLVIKPGFNKTGYNGLKYLPKSPTISHFRELLKHHDWLMSLGDMNQYLHGISKIKLEQFAGEAKSLDASDFESITPAKKYTLIISLIQHAQCDIKDKLAITFCKTIAKIHKRAEKKLDELKEENEQTTHNLLTIFGEVLVDCKEQQPSLELSEKILNHINDNGGATTLHTDCERAAACNSKNYRPLLWDFYISKRPTLLRLLRTLEIKSATQDDLLIQAMIVLLGNSDKKSEYLDLDASLLFASKKWQALVRKKVDGIWKLNRRHLETCVMTYLAKGLHSGDLYIAGAKSFADYRKMLLSWQDCKPLLSEYCNETGLPDNAKDFVLKLKKESIEKALKIDNKYPTIKELIIDEAGNPILKRRSPKRRSSFATWLEKEIKARMPERNVLDILCSTHHYTGWAHTFGPISGIDPKIGDPIERYIITNFAYGSRMGPTQASKHIKSNATPHMISWINRRHITVKSLDAALVKLINLYRRFKIITAWGSGDACAADGTMCNIREENLLAEFHIRYGQKGGIAYHHVSDNYIALFSTFIPCGVWEAVEIIEGLLKNKSEIKPSIIHADTQGQSAVVFALSYLFGFKLMPRIRNWDDMKFSRPIKGAKYKHIDSLFGEPVNWELIETHWQDMMQVVLSIKAGKITSSLLLRKLSNYSYKNKLYSAFRELGRVIRTNFLLEYISDVELREMITATTNKVEGYNGLCEWTSFGGMELVASNDDTEMEKAVKYNDIINNSIMLQNVIDMSEIVNQLTQEGVVITKEDLAGLSPYIVRHLKRFGDYLIDLDGVPNIIGPNSDLSLW